ncbi:YdeI/OmpD-associated family protein [Kribbella sp. NPDC051587]|uniref:YdeI/OmpD-associated family protein n=1 Tax=Kribbella sp. NPDC051587 TaxID=3364119 RepID=UPI0037B91751
METFDGVIVVEDGGGAWVEVPGEVIAGLGGGGRIPVLATFDGVEYRGSIASMGGCMALGVLKGIRAELGKGGGDTVAVTVERDTAERTVDVPDDFAEALAAADLRNSFDKLSYSHRREHVQAVLDANKPETRARRIAKALEMLLDRAGQNS